jgi:hypothetical protein
VQDNRLDPIGKSSFKQERPVDATGSGANMAKSSKRTKRPSVLSGIPQRIVDLSPREWSSDRRAKWCRAYLAGAASPDAPVPSKTDRDHVLAYRQGQRSAATLRTEVAQVADVRRTAAARRERYEDQRERALSNDRLDILQRLDRLSGLTGGFGPPGDFGHRINPHDDPTILALAGAALGAGASLVPVIKGR